MCQFRCFKLLYILILIFFGLNQDRQPTKSLALITLGIISFPLPTDFNHEADSSGKTINFFCHSNYRYRVQTPGMVKEGLTERSLISNLRLDGPKVCNPGKNSANWSGCISKVQVRVIYQTKLCNDNFENERVNKSS